MNKVKASHIILTKPEYMNELQFIEQVGRTCYKSEDKITPDGESAKKFVSMLLKRGHEAMIEHWSYIFMLPESSYKELTHILRKLEDDTGHRTFLRLTNIRNRPVVSGNIRAWRDFIRGCHYTRLHVPAWIVYQFVMFSNIKKILFEDILSPDEYIWCPEVGEVYRMSKEDLIEEERKYHYDVTVKFTCDRGISHELVRHRDASFAQESTRYCNYSNDKFGNAISVIDVLTGITLDHKMRSLTADVTSLIISEWEQAMLDAEKHYLKMIELGASPQIARDVLPNSVKTELVMTANLGEWFKFLSLRLPDSAHPQMRELTYEMYKDFMDIDPFIFVNITACSS